MPGRNKKSTMKKYVRKGYNVAKTAYAAYNIASKIASLVNIEWKHHDVRNSAVIVDHTGNNSILNDPQQGVTDLERIGDSIKCQHLLITGDVQRAAAATSNATVVTLYIVWDRDNKLVGTTDLLEAATLTSTLAPYSHKRYDKRFQSRILRKFTFRIDAGDPLRSFKMRVPLSKVLKQKAHTQFDNGSTVITTGALKFMFVSSEPLATAPLLQYNSRLLYTDD